MMSTDVVAVKKNWFARHKVLTFLGVLVVLLIVVVSQGGGGSTGSAGAGKDLADAVSADTVLTFEVTGSARSGSMTWVGDGMSTVQENGAKLPWKKVVTYKEGTLGVNMSAQNEGGGTITCTIKEDGKVLSTNTSKGEYAIVMCSV